MPRSGGKGMFLLMMNLSVEGFQELLTYIEENF